MPGMAFDRSGDAPKFNSASLTSQAQVPQEENGCRSPDRSRSERVNRPTNCCSSGTGGTQVCPVMMGLLRRLYTGLQLQVNESKSAVDLAWNRKILGYSFWVAPGRVIKRRVANKALATMKEKVRLLTRRTVGRSIPNVIAELRSYLLGWKEYFRLADTPNVFGELDEWIRHRLRAIHLKQWRQGKTVFRELRARGLSARGAAKPFGPARGWYRRSSPIHHR
jgi:RNA-directed DNA polymerase